MGMIQISRDKGREGGFYANRKADMPRWEDRCVQETVRSTA